MLGSSGSVPRVGDDGTSQQCALQLSAAKLPDGTLFESFESHAGDDMLAFFSLLGSEAGGEDFGYLVRKVSLPLPKSGISGRWYYTAADSRGKLRVKSGKLRVGGCFSRGMEVDFSGCRFQQTEDALDECCLTASVRTDDAQKVPFVNVQVDVVEYGTAVVSGSKVLYFDNRFHVWRITSFMYHSVINAMEARCYSGSIGVRALATFSISVSQS